MQWDKKLILLVTLVHSQQNLSWPVSGPRVLHLNTFINKSYYYNFTAHNIYYASNYAIQNVRIIRACMVCFGTMCARLAPLMSAKSYQALKPRQSDNCIIAGCQLQPKLHNATSMVQFSSEGQVRSSISPEQSISAKVMHWKLQKSLTPQLHFFKVNCSYFISYTENKNWLYKLAYTVIDNDSKVLVI